MKTLTITPEVAEVLRRCTLTETSVVLPTQLTRPLYEAVNKVLGAQGGRWNKKAQAHLFPQGVDPRVVFAEALASGTIVHEKQSRQSFYTPPEIALFVAQGAGLGEGATVLEPSAGEGSLVDAILDVQPAVGVVVAVENDPRAMGVMRERFGNRPNVRFEEADFLSLAPLPTLRAHQVVMNPPFSDGQEIEHVMQASRFLHVGGTLSAIVSKAVTFRTDRSYARFREWLTASFKDLTITNLPEDAFRESGTGVHTVLIRGWLDRVVR